jgi:hypothetical protein
MKNREVSLEQTEVSEVRDHPDDGSSTYYLRKLYWNNEIVSLSWLDWSYELVQVFSADSLGGGKEGRREVPTAHLCFYFIIYSREAE